MGNEQPDAGASLGVLGYATFPARDAGYQPLSAAEERIQRH